MADSDAKIETAIKWARRVYAENLAGGNLHCVLDDGNFSAGENFCVCMIWMEKCTYAEAQCALSVDLLSDEEFLEFRQRRKEYQSGCDLFDEHSDD